MDALNFVQAWKVSSGEQWIVIKKSAQNAILAIIVQHIWHFDELKVCGDWLLKFDFFFLGNCTSSGLFEI